jgi:peptide/nickel transport system substrate-binding protein
MKKVLLFIFVLLAFGAVALIQVNAAEKPKDTLTVVISNDIGTLDPHDNTWFAHHQVTRQIYETLVVRGNQGKLVPWLAESWEFPDDLTILFHIRRGVKFHNGDELKASDVLFSLKRAFSDNTTGALQVNRVNFDACKVIDEYTVKVVTKEPYAMQLAMLENPLICIISERAYKESKGDFRAAPIGTGPYKFVSYNSGDKVVLVANENYWIKGEPKTKNVIFRIIADSSSRAIEAESGGADIVYDIGANDLKRVKSNPKVNLVTTLGYNTSYLNFNAAKKPLDNPLVREAIWYAVDVKSAIDIAYGSFGAVATGFVSPGIEGRHPDLSPWFPKRDVAKAKALLAKAGYPNGLTLHICCENSNQQRMDFCEAIQAQLTEVGVKLILDFMEANDLSATLNNGGAELAAYGFTASSGEAGRILMRWLPNATEFKVWNWKDDNYIALCSKALATIDDKARNEMFYKCQEILMEGRVALPIWHKELNAALKPDVKGFNLTPTYEQHYLQHVYFE